MRSIRNRPTIITITADAAGPVRARLPFLDAERDAEIVSEDGRGGLTREQTVVTPDEPLEIEVPENGGFVARSL